MIWLALTEFMNNKKIRLETNSILNVLKFILTFPLIVILGVLAKIIDFYYIEIPLLFVTLIVALWFYRVSYKVKFKLDGFEACLKIKYNVFNYKFITLMVTDSQEKFILHEKTKSDFISLCQERNNFKVDCYLNLRKDGCPQILVE